MCASCHYSSLLPGIAHLHERDQMGFCCLRAFMVTLFLLFHTLSSDLAASRRSHLTEV
jgi:hypothetical protein